jgi:Fe-S cluster assembly protein SufD
VSLLELPSARDEGWRWSDLSALPDLATREPGGLHSPLPNLWLDPAQGGPRLLFVDGVFMAERSDPGPVELGPVSIDASGHPLGRLAGSRGWRLQLGRDHAPAGLVQIVHIATGGADHLAAEIELDVDAQASVLETFIGDGWANRLTAISLFKGARLMLSRRLLGSSGFVSLMDRARIGEGASLVSILQAAGSTDSRIEGEVELAGEAAYAEVGGALLARGRQRHDANLVLRHLMPNGVSRQVWRSVAAERSTCSVAARVEVARGAQRTDGEQSLKGLLLDRGATVNTKPELEIFADDVKCAHGATVGELDRNALFYLASRGIPRPEAQALLTRAFVGDALDRIGEDEVRDAFYADAGRWFD